MCDLEYKHLSGTCTRESFICSLQANIQMHVEGDKVFINNQNLNNKQFTGEYRHNKASAYYVGIRANMKFTSLNQVYRVIKILGNLYTMFSFVTYNSNSEFRIRNATRERYQLIR